MRAIERVGSIVGRRVVSIEKHTSSPAVCGNASDSTSSTARSTARRATRLCTTARRQPLVAGVLEGINATVFAYGSTGSGKTHTMVGTKTDPGLMILSLRDVFRGIQRAKNDSAFEVTCSYTEVYNELVFDLLASPPRKVQSRKVRDDVATPLELNAKTRRAGRWSRV